MSFVSFLEQFEMPLSAVQWEHSRGGHAGRPRRHSAFPGNSTRVTSCWEGPVFSLQWANGRTSVSSQSVEKVFLLGTFEVVAYLLGQLPFQLKREELWGVACSVLLWHWKCSECGEGGTALNTWNQGFARCKWVSFCYVNYVSVKLFLTQ